MSGRRELTSPSYMRARIIIPFMSRGLEPLPFSPPVPITISCHFVLSVPWEQEDGTQAVALAYLSLGRNRPRRRARG